MKTSLLIVLCLIGVSCDSHSSAVPADTFSQAIRKERWADFTSVVITDIRNPQGDNRYPIREAVHLFFIPNKIGAYYVEAPGSITEPKVFINLASKGISSPEVTSNIDLDAITFPVGPTTQPTPQYPGAQQMDFWGATRILVTFSDGKEIQRTVLKADP